MSAEPRPLALHTATERPDLWERGIPSQSVWPEYNLHGDVVNEWWPHLADELADYQFVLYDAASDAVVAEGHTAPMWWDGMDETCRMGSARRSPGRSRPSALGGS